MLEIRHEDEFYRRLGGGTTGLAEAYIAGDWDSSDLVGLFTVFAGHLPAVTRGPVRGLRRWYVPAQPAEDEATLDGARRNIQRHYDLSNEMFALFLDPTMTYSSALFHVPLTGHNEQTAIWVTVDDVSKQLWKTGQAPGLKATELSPKTRSFQIVMAKGDDVGPGLAEFAQKNHLTNAHFTAIGALDHAVIGWSDGEPVLTPYDDCMLVMPSLRQLRPGVTVVRLGKIEQRIANPR